MHIIRETLSKKSCSTIYKKSRTTAYLLTMTIVLGLNASARPAFSEGLGDANLLSGITGKIIEVNPYKIVENIDPDTIGLPKKFIIDLKAKMLRPSKESIIRKTLSFKKIAHIENTIVLQGIDEGIEGAKDGLAWSLTLSKENGSATLSASGDGVAYVVFGTVTPIK